MITVVGDRDDMNAGDSGPRGFTLELPDDASLGRAIVTLFDERCAPRRSAPWVISLLADPVTVHRDDHGRVLYLDHERRSGRVVGCVVDETFTLLDSWWTLRTPLAETGHRLTTGEYALFLTYVGQGVPLGLDEVRRAVG